MPFGFDNFITGLATGLSQNNGPIGGFGQGFMASKNAIDEKEAKEKLGDLLGDELGDLARLNKEDALKIWENQQKLNLLKQQQLAKQYDTTNEIKNYNSLVGLGVKPEDAMNIAWKIKSGENMSPEEKAYKTQQAKKQADIDVSQRDFESMKPVVENALDRANKALESGTGLGRIGGLMSWAGLSTNKGQSNRADIDAANTQMNTILRKKLASTGLTGSELNSAVEAQAYRYVLSPWDDETTTARKIENFKTDVLGAGQNSYKNMTDEELLGGL